MKLVLGTVVPTLLGDGFPTVTAAALIYGRSGLRQTWRSGRWSGQETAPQHCRPDHLPLNPKHSVRANLRGYRIEQ